MHTDFGNLPDLISDLEAYRGLVMAPLEGFERNDVSRGSAPLRGEASSPREIHAREVAGILLYRFKPNSERGHYLCGLLRSAPQPDKLAAIRDSLSMHPEMAGVDELSEMLRGQRSDLASQIRAACVLAKLDSSSTIDWSKSADVLKEALMAEDRRAAPRWIELLGPAARALVPSLMRDCNDPKVDGVARANAAEALGEVLAEANSPEELAEDRILDAQPAPSRLLGRALMRLHRREAGLDLLRKAATRQPNEAVVGGTNSDAEARKNDSASRQAGAATTMSAIGETGLLWPLLRHQADPRLRAQLVNRLADSGIPLPTLLDRMNWPILDPAERQALLMGLAEGTMPAANSTARDQDLRRPPRPICSSMIRTLASIPPPSCSSAPVRPEVDIETSRRRPIVRGSPSQREQARLRKWGPEGPHLRNPARPIDVLDGLPR